MRIVVVGNGRSPHVATRSAAVAARGHDVRLVTLGPVLPSPGVELCTRPLPRSLWQAVRAARSFFRDIRSHRPELLHLHYAGGRLGTLAVLSGVHPLVVTVMGGDVLPEQHEGGLPRLERRATRRILAAADHVLVKSDGLRPALASFGLVDTPVDTIRWGVDLERFRRDPPAAEALRQRLGLSAEDRVVLSPRILSPLYNIDLVIEALPAVLSRVPEALLLVTEHAADPGYKASLERRITTLGLGDRVRFVGAILHEEMPAYYSLAELAVSVPRSDGLPQSLFEALACGTPSVLGRLAAYEEIVADGESALLADFEPGALAEAIHRLLVQPSLRTAIATAGLQQVQRLGSLPAETERVEAIYQRVVQAARPRRRQPLGSLLDTLGLLVRGLT